MKSSSTQRERRFTRFWIILLIAFGFGVPHASAQTIAANDTVGCAPKLIAFSGTNLGSVSGYLWNFGDNTTSTLATPGKIYATPGTYTVTLTITRPGGAQLVISKAAWIKVFGKPVPAFTTSVLPNANPCTPTRTVKFTNTTIGGTNNTYLWDFGDGSNSTLQSPNHAYTASGTFNVQLLVTSPNGCQDILNTSVTVSVVSGVSAAFGVSNTNLCSIRYPIFFTDSCTHAGPITYRWDFGDGTNSQVANPNHVYAASGTYNVRLIARTPSGCQDTAIRQITVNALNLFAGLAMPTGGGCLGSSLPFSLPDTNTLYYWSFGPGQLDTGYNVTHTFNSPGNYTVRIYADNGMGCRDTLILANAISVASGVNVVLTATPGALPCAYPLPYSFTATGATATAWAYSIVNAAGVTLASGTTKNFTYSFQTPGTYLVTSIGSRSSCTSQDTLQLQISAQLTYAKFGTTIDSGCQPVTVHFLDSSFAAANQTITSRLWDFGDGTSSTLVNPTHTYAQVGQYTPQLTVTTSGGCSSTFSYARMVRVGTHPIADFGPRMDSACAPLAVQFSNQSTDTLAIGTKYFWDFGDGTHSTARDPKKTWNKPGRYTVKLYTSNNGCVDSSIAFRSFYVDSPMARFYALNPVGCDTPFTVFFRDSSISAHTWAWDFGDPASGANNTSTLRFPQHTYTQFGNYAVSLTVTNPNGCQHTALKQNYIHISDPHSRFSTADTGGCRPLSVAFNNTSTMGTYRWDFGDSTTSIQTAPTHVYANPGYYTVKLITRDVNGCFDTLVRPNYIHAVGPTAKFTPNGYVGCIAFYVNFTDNSFGYSAPIVRRHWQFGDPNSGALDTSNLLNPMHAYTVNGNYTVRLTVWDANGCSQTASRVNIIQVRNPIVRFTADTVRCLGLPVQFTAQPNNGIGWFWKFGDGTTDTGRTPQHAYTALGNYTVQLFVTNGLGCVDSLTKVAYVHVIQIHPRPYALPTVAVCAPKPIQFMDSTRYANAWQWDFGDGTGSTLQNPSHIYATNGWFNVKLKVWSLGGCEDSITVDSMVHLIGPRASYSFTQQGHCTIASVQFFNTSQDYTSCVWDFGDGSVSTSPNPVHQYNRSGTFNPVLIVYDATGCQASANPLPQIHVDTIPTAAFTVDVHTSCGPATVQFTDSSHNAVRYLWLFGDGTMDSASTNPVHTYFTGQFSPTLIVWNAAGCTDTLTLPGTVAVHTRPTAVFSADQPLGCPPHNVHFIDSSFATFGGHIVSWAWAFGDSASASLNASTQRNPNHTYNFPGKYTVRLIVHDDAGCTDTLTRIEYIVVKDSTPPQNTHITFVTVLNDAAVGLQWLPSQEPAFAAYALYRNDPTTGSTFTLLHTFTSRTDTAWVDLTTDVHHNSYCYYVSVIDICGKPSAPASNITHCSVLENATPAADPNLSGIDVKWTPYIGWTTLNRYRIYRKTQSQLVYTYIDSVPASQRTYTDAGMCPDTVAYKIVAVDTSSNLYLSLSNSAISPTSFHFNVAPISMLSATVVNGENRIFMHWPSMGGGKEILTYVVYRSPDGVNYIPNYATTPDTAFEDHDVDVNKEIWSYKVQAQDKCGHKTPLGEQGRNIRLTAEASGMDIRLSWTGYLEWKSGIDHYVVERLDPTTGLWDSLASTAPNMLMYFRPYDNSNLAQYKFRVTARQRGGAHQSSTSNYAEVVLPPTLFIPTAFTPNGNGLNEAFTIKGLHIAQYECEVYNRWGQSIFVTTDMDHPWDGMVAGQLAEQGVYAYRVYARGFNGFTETRYGTVSILR